MLNLLRSRLAVVVCVPSSGAAYTLITLLAHWPHLHFAFFWMNTLAHVGRQVHRRRPKADKGRKLHTFRLTCN